MTTDRPRAARRLRAAGALPTAAILLAAGAVIEALVRLRLAPVTQHSTAGAAGLCAVSALATLPLVAPNPATAAGLMLTAGLLSLLAFHSLTIAGLLAAGLAGYRVGRSGASLRILGLCLPYLITALLGASPGASESAALTTLTCALVPAAGLLGASGRLRALDEDRHRNRQDFEERLLEHTKRGERARIARELHDIVAHHISMISVQAETARLTTPGLPEAGARRFLAIGDTARAALTEMRRLLGVLKDDHWPDAEVTLLRPQPGLGHVTELVDEAREASGATTRLVLSGKPASFDPGVELAAYRIIQEALTNARRHAPGAAVDIELCYAETELRLRVRDNGPGPAPEPESTPAPEPESAPEPGSATPSAGHGLAGMRERAAAVGGKLTLGGAPGGGFSVEAVLPAQPRQAA